MIEMNKEKTKSWVVKFKLRFERGYYYIRYIQSFAMIAFLLDYFKLSYIFIIPIIIASYFIGYADEMKGIWKKEVSYGVDNLIDWNKRIEGKIDKILEEKK